MAVPQQRKSSGVYYFRRRIPADLVEVLGKTEVIISLNTKDVAEAKHKHAEEAVRFNDMVARHRREIARPFDAVTLPRAAALVGAWLLDLLDEDEVRRQGEEFPPEHDDSADVSAYDLVEEEVGRINALPERRKRTATLAYAAEDVARVAALNGLRIEKGSLSEERLAKEALDARLRAASVFKLRASGEWAAASRRRDEVLREYPGLTSRGTAHVDLVALRSVPAGTPNLLAATDYYLDAKQHPIGTAMEVRKTVRRFAELHGDVPVASIDKAMVREWRDALLKLPKRQSARQKKMNIRELVADSAALPLEALISFTSVNKDVGLLSAVLATASTQWKFADGWSNPALGMKISRNREQRRKKRQPFSEDDLKRIFGTPIYTLGARPAAGAGEAAKWLPLLALYTGARLGELGQLLARDVRRIGGVWCIDINEEEGKHVKTASSIRFVPLHSDLIEGFGFLDYARARQSLGDNARLFPDLVPDVKGVLTGSWGKWFGRHLRLEVERGGCGIDDPRKVFHSFRHTFKTLARTARIPKDVSDHITGHASGDVGDSYGLNEPAVVRADWLNKIDFAVVRTTAIA